MMMMMMMLLSSQGCALTPMPPISISIRFTYVLQDWQQCSWPQQPPGASDLISPSYIPLTGSWNQWGASRRFMTSLVSRLTHTWDIISFDKWTLSLWQRRFYRRPHAPDTFTLCRFSLDDFRTCGCCHGVICDGRTHLCQYYIDSVDLWVFTSVLSSADDVYTGRWEYSMYIPSWLISLPYITVILS